MTSLLDLPPDQWDLGGGVPAYRAKQIAEWIYEKRAESFDAMSNLPVGMRQQLAVQCELRPLEMVRVQGAEDTTRKFLWRLKSGGDFVESVLIPASPALYGERADRFTLCVSSQVGCAYGCRFCASGLDGWKRNLTAGEIVAQVIEVERATGERINNLVFMGMGEPLANYANLMAALDIINAEWGVGIGARRITISTSGLVPIIRKLADQPKQFRLALSLHGATDEVRNQIMPVNEKWPLAELLEACAYYQERKKKRMTLEYILIDGINDDLSQARLLGLQARRLRANVNLIPYNTVEGLDWKRPGDERVEEFARIVRDAGVVATVRLEKGHDIDAACGQLRLKAKQNEGTPA